MDYKENLIRRDVRTKATGMRTQKASAARRVVRRKSPTVKVVPLHAPDNCATEVINSWCPSDPAVKKVWDEIAPAVRAHLLAADIGGPELARKYMRALSRHAAARHGAGHRINAAADLFNDLALISTFGSATVSSIGVSSKATELTYIRRIRAALLPDLYAIPAPLRMGAKQIAQPYSQSELAALLAFARQRSAVRNIRIHAGLLLGLGAGLSGSEIPMISGSDLAATPWGLVIAVPQIKGKPTRLVPVLAAYENELAQLALLAKGDPFLGVKDSSQPRGANEMQPETAGVPHFRAGRSRATWMLTLLAGGASYVAMRQAGTSAASDKTLFLLSKDITIDLADYVRQLRMSEKPFDYAAFSALTQYEAL